MSFILITGLIGLLIWLSVILAPWRPYSTKESIDSSSDSKDFDLSNLTVIIPARNEASQIADTLRAIIQQGKNHRIIVVNDESSDNTSHTVQLFSDTNVEIINGQPPQNGWYGKLWALEQGRREVTSEFILLLDADISLQPGILMQLFQQIQNNNLQMTSLMACLRMNSFWEKLLMPAFIYFFKLLYPFHLANQQSHWVSAAAGGCILLKTDALNSVGGFEPIKNTLIDDCSLAQLFKKHGKKTWVGLTHSAVSTRPYRDLNSIWLMVTRTAFTQLQHSLIRIAICGLLMYCAFISPLITLFIAPHPIPMSIAITCLILMLLSYLPILDYYSIHRIWAFTLPFAGLLYLLMTLDSAIKYYFGTGAQWKGRNYGKYK